MVVLRAFVVGAVALAQAVVSGAMRTSLTLKDLRKQVRRC